MIENLAGVLLVLLGLLLALRGSSAIRALLTVLGAVVGYGYGAALASGASATSPLASVPPWVAGAVAAVLLGLLAYFVYVAAVILAFGVLGLSLGSALASWLGIPWDWATTVVALVIGVGVALLAIALRLPRALLIIVSAFLGASTLVSGALILTLQPTIGTSPDALPTWATVLYVAVVIVGLIVQFGSAAPRRSGRDQWSRSAPAPA